MTNEELLEEAKRRYPIGTTFKCLHDCRGGPIMKNDHSITKSGMVIRVLDDCGCIYDSGKWAEIVSKPEPQYEVGKWYKLINDTGKYFVKIYETRSGIFDKMILGEFIVNSYHKSGGFYIKDIKSLTELTDLSEIQQYLPDGHTDKIDIKYHVVHIKNKSQYDLIYQHYPNLDKAPLSYLPKLGVVINGNAKLGYYSDIEWFKESKQVNRTKIYSFEEWLSNHYPPGYAASVKEDLISRATKVQEEYDELEFKIKSNYLKTNNNEETGNICKVQRSNSSKIGSSDITRGIAIKSSSSKGKIGSGYCYN